MLELLKNQPILALSWKAPFAQLMLHDKIETRTWPTKYRGWVLICCSKNSYLDTEVVKMSGIVQFNRIIHTINSYLPYTELYNLHEGKAIAIGKLICCRPMQKNDEDACFLQFKEPWTEEKILANGEIKMKDKMLWCHIYSDVRPIKPFDFKGVQGWKKLTAAEIEKIHLL